MAIQENERGQSDGGTWISPHFFEADLKPDDWPEDRELRAGVEWLLGFLDPQAWRTRRFAALQRFVNAVTGASVPASGNGRMFDDSDRFGWYLFLGQAFLDHPTVFDFIYGSRVIPVLRSIGQNVELLQGVQGVDERVRRLVGAEKRQANAGLFELLVAAAYRHRGAEVRFLPERPGVAKTHDMDVVLDGVEWAVECKRLEDGEYSEFERTRARKLWLPLARAFYERGFDVQCTATFLTELTDVPDRYLLLKARRWLDQGALLPLEWSDKYSVGSLRRLNLKPLQDVLETDDVVYNSTRMHELVTGRYRPNSHIITTMVAEHADTPGYIKSCSGGCVFDWNSVSETATNKKARDVVKRLSDGCKQLPASRPGIVHIAFEATDGNEVEAVRYKKILATIAEFDPGQKPLEYVYVHWLAPECPPSAPMAFDETAHWQAVRPTRQRPLENGLLVLPPGVESRSGVHWTSAQVNTGVRRRPMSVSL